MLWRESLCEPKASNMNKFPIPAHYVHTYSQAHILQVLPTTTCGTHTDHIQSIGSAWTTTCKQAHLPIAMQNTNNTVKKN